MIKFILSLTDIKLLLNRSKRKIYIIVMHICDVCMTWLISTCNWNWYVLFVFLYHPQTKFGAVYRNHPVRPSICPSVRPSMCMKEYGCCLKFRRGDNSTYTFTKKGVMYLWRPLDVCSCLVYFRDGMLSPWHNSISIHFS